jgi:cholest-4-en-3-one 26-monooxygenase
LTRKPNIPAGFDFTDPDIYAERLPVDELAELRRVAPIWWNQQPLGDAGFDDGGFWVVTKHRDVKEISIRSEVFSSRENSALPSYSPGRVKEAVERGRITMLNQDPPDHTRLRKIVSRAFTPRMIERLRAELTRRSRDVARAARAAGSGDFVEQVACELPLQAIAGLLGVPQRDRMKLFHWSNQMVSDQDPEFADHDPVNSSVELISYTMQLASDRSGRGGDDLVSTLMRAGDGGSLNDTELGLFVVMLAVAGNETTRNSITQGMMAFTDFPDQWELFKAKRPATAADEIIRWATPVTSFQRTAMVPYDLSGVRIEAGQRVVMFYRSANFDEDVFDDPFSFDVMRDPNPHVSFGGTGAHYCVGASLARMTVDLMFNAIADEIPHLTARARPERLRSGFLNGIKHWQVDYAADASGTN